jgi:hypothetical protein
VLRKLLIAAVAAGLLAAPAQAQFNRVLLMPGVTYERQVQFTSHGPVAVHVMFAPKPGGLWQLKPMLSNGAIVGRERVTAMQRSVAGAATVAGVNGDLFTWADGRPSGILMQGGQLVHPPLPERSSLGIGADGTLRVDRVRMFGTWRGTGQRRPMDLNQAPRPNGVSLFTPAWGPTTPSNSGAVEAVILPYPAATPNVDVTGPVVQVAQNGGSVIPAGGAVLVAKGTAAQRLLEEAPVGTNVTIRLLLSPDWTGIADAIGGGPVLVRDGKPVFRHFEAFSTAQIARNPRTGVGQLADGRIVLVVVDGRQPGYSTGMTNFELAQTLVRLGAVTAMGLDAGGSSTMAFEGGLLNRPSDPGGERAVSEGFFVLYGGAYAVAPAEFVHSPNGDGVADLQRLAVKLVRPSRATVSLIGPDKVARTLDEGDKSAGTYRYDWTGEGAPEGQWRLSVTAVDDQGQSSTADRIFFLNRTLADLDVAGRRAQFTLTRPATVTVTVRRRTGAIVATVVSRKSLAAGRHTLTWNGRAGRRKAPTGRYQLRVTAVNTVGRIELAGEFAHRRR